MVDGFDTTLPLLLQLILGFLALLAIGWVNVRVSGDEGELHETFCSALFGVLLSRHVAVSVRRVACAAAPLPGEVRGMPPDIPRYRRWLPNPLRAHGLR